MATPSQPPERRLVVLSQLGDREEFTFQLARGDAQIAAARKTCYLLSVSSNRCLRDYRLPQLVVGQSQCQADFPLSRDQAEAREILLGLRSSACPAYRRTAKTKRFRMVIIANLGRPRINYRDLQHLCRLVSASFR